LPAGLSGAVPSIVCETGVDGSAKREAQLTCLYSLNFIVSTHHWLYDSFWHWPECSCNQMNSPAFPKHMVTFFKIHRVHCNGQIPCMRLSKGSWFQIFASSISKRHEWSQFLEKSVLAEEICEPASFVLSSFVACPFASCATCPRGTAFTYLLCVPQTPLLEQFA